MLLVISDDLNRKETETKTESFSLVKRRKILCFYLGLGTLITLIHMETFLAFNILKSITNKRMSTVSCPRPPALPWRLVWTSQNGGSQYAVLELEVRDLPCLTQFRTKQRRSYLSFIVNNCFLLNFG